MSKMRFEIDLDTVKSDVMNLPAEIAALADVEPGAHHLYREGDAGFALDTGARDELAAELDKLAESQNLKAENATLRKGRDRQLIVETVRGGLLKAGVRPELLEAAVLTFLAKHECMVKADKAGVRQVIVVGVHGAAEAAEAAVRFLDDEAAQAALADAATPDPETGGGAISAAFRKLH